jgi:hypothetical protein
MCAVDTEIMTMTVTDHTRDNKPTTTKTFVMQYTSEHKLHQYDILLLHTYTKWCVSILRQQDHIKNLQNLKKFPRFGIDFRFWTSKKCPFFKSQF